MRRISIKKVSLSRSTPMKDMYREYLSRYNQKANQIRERYGAEMYASASPNQMNFEMLFRGMQASNPKMSANRIVDKIISRQASQVQWNSAKSIAEAQFIGASPYNIERIRFDKNFVMEEVSSSYHTMRRDGLASTEAAHLISSYYFGSQV